MTGDAGDGRSYRIAVAANCELEEAALTKLAEVWLCSAMWSCMPQASQTFAERCLAFRLLSRVGCTIHMYVRRRHASFPIRLFALLSDESLAATFAELPDCMLDPASLKLRVTYPTLSGPEFKATLTMFARAAWVDIAGIEARHATLRRIIHTRNQTHTISLQELGSHWVMLQGRRRKLGVKKHFKCKASYASPADARTRGRKQNPTKRTGGGGGRWRGFVRLQTLGISGVFAWGGAGN